MGTRADFYVGKNTAAKWIGSIAWDGYRSGIDAAVLKARTARQFRAAVKKFFSTRDDVTLPERGWPWPWDTSATTDCSYWFFGGEVWEAYGHPHEYYVRCSKKIMDEESPRYTKWLMAHERVTFPDMGATKNVRFGDSASGLVVLTSRSG